MYDKIETESPTNTTQTDEIKDSENKKKHIDSDGFEALLDVYRTLLGWQKDLQNNKE